MNNYILIYYSGTDEPVDYVQGDKDFIKNFIKKENLRRDEYTIIQGKILKHEHETCFDINKLK